MINPQRACARVTVAVCLCVRACVCVCVCVCVCHLLILTATILSTAWACTQLKYITNSNCYNFKQEAAS